MTIKRFASSVLLSLSLSLPLPAQTPEAITSPDEGATADGASIPRSRPARTTIDADVLRRLLDRYRTKWSFLRLSVFGLNFSSRYQFFNPILNYDHFNGDRSLYHVTAGYAGKDILDGIAATGFTAGFLYGAVLDKKLYRAGARVFSLDMGGLVNHVAVDGNMDTWSHPHVTGNLKSYEFRLGPRFDLFLRMLPQKSIIDMWASVYVHLVAGYRAVERIEDGTAVHDDSGAGAGVAGGILLSAALFNIDIEAGHFRETFVRLGFGFGFRI